MQSVGRSHLLLICMLSWSPVIYFIFSCFHFLEFISLWSSSFKAIDKNERPWHGPGPIWSAHSSWYFVDEVVTLWPARCKLTMMNERTFVAKVLGDCDKKNRSIVGENCICSFASKCFLYFFLLTGPYSEITFKKLVFVLVTV